ncbi:hypothetical protein JW905_18600, partial [bacterium]|nr:hypothetical protein [candidate division CSSED10-310 bacterium]
PRDFLDLYSLMLTAAGLPAPETPAPPGIVSEVYSAQHPVMSAGVRELFTGELRSLMQPPWKLIQLSDGRRQLFHTGSDPEEQDDLAERQPEIVNAMSAALDDYLSGLSVLAAAIGQDDVNLDESDQEALRTLGYVQ